MYTLHLRRTKVEKIEGTETAKQPVVKMRGIRACIRIATIEGGMEGFKQLPKWERGKQKNAGSRGVATKIEHHKDNRG